MYYFKKSTTTSPTIIMDSLSRTALIKGVSLCTDDREIKSTLLEVKSQLDRYHYANLSIQLKSFNTKMANSLLYLLKGLKEEEHKSMPVINWFYEESDTEMRQMGEDYSELLEIKFNLLAS